MKELFNPLDRWLGSATPAAIARVVDLDGSGPRLPGAAMAVTIDQDVRGSVSGGCVEGAVVIEALDVIESAAHRVVSFGYSDDEAFAVGLTCGGTIHLFIETFDPADWYEPLKADVAAEQAVALATVIEGPTRVESCWFEPTKRPVRSRSVASVTRDSIGSSSAMLEVNWWPVNQGCGTTASTARPERASSRCSSNRLRRPRRC